MTIGITRGLSTGIATFGSITAMFAAADAAKLRAAQSTVATPSLPTSTKPSRRGKAKTPKMSPLPPVTIPSTRRRTLLSSPSPLPLPSTPTKSPSSMLPISPLMSPSASLSSTSPLLTVSSMSSLPLLDVYGSPVLPPSAMATPKRKRGQRQPRIATITSVGLTGMARSSVSTQGLDEEIGISLTSHSNGMPNTSPLGLRGGAPPRLRSGTGGSDNDDDYRTTNGINGHDDDDDDDDDNHTSVKQEHKRGSATSSSSSSSSSTAMSSGFMLRAPSEVPPHAPITTPSFRILNDLDIRTMLAQERVRHFISLNCLIISNVCLSLEIVRWP
jgi:hypothetical protein